MQKLTPFIVLVNIILIIINVLLALLVFSKPRVYCLVPVDIETSQRVDALIHQVNKLEGAYITLQTAYWNEHPKDRMFLLACMQSYAVDNKTKSALERLKRVETLSGN